MKISLRLSICRFLMSAAASSLLACTHTTVQANGTPTQTAAAANSNQPLDGVLSLWSSSVKDKPGRFDVSFNIKNLSPNRGVLLLMSDLSCGRGDHPGTLRYASSKLTDQNIDIRAGQTRSLNFICNVGPHVTGDYVISIAKVYENPKSDGKTIGPLITSGLGWHLVDATSK